MDKVTFTMHTDKVTKGTFRYEEEIETGKEKVIGSLYIRKDALGGAAPERIQVTIEDAPSEG